MRTRNRAIAVGVLGLLAVGLSWSPSDAARASTMRWHVGVALDELALQGGVMDDQGAVMGDGLGVMVVASGGASWITDGVRAAVEAHPAFSYDERSAHLVRVEPVEAPGATAMVIRLWRGWDLRTERPLLVRHHGALSALALAGGAAVATLRGWVSLGLLLAGVLAVLLLALAPLAPELQAGSHVEQILNGPLLIALDRWLRSLSAMGLASLVALAAFAATLSWFDHRSSRDQLRARSAGGAALAATVGVALLVETGLRSGLIGAATTPAGGAALLALAAAWAVPVHAAWRRWRARPGSEETA